LFAFLPARKSAVGTLAPRFIAGDLIGKHAEAAGGNTASAPSWPWGEAHDASATEMEFLSGQSPHLV